MSIIKKCRLFYASISELKYGEPFERNIPIFGQSGGYTFVMPGIYEIQAVLRLSPTDRVVSNTVQCEVHRIKPESATSMEMFKALSPGPAAKLLYDRSRMPPKQIHDRLKRFVARHQSTQSAAAVQCSLGRTLLKSSEVSPKAARSNSLKEQSLRHLEKVLNHPHLSNHRCDVAKQLLNGHGRRG